MVSILSHNGGSKNLEVFIDETQSLTKQGQTWQMLGISIGNVVSILSKHGGHIKLQKVLKYLPLLCNFGFSVTDVISAVSLPVEHFSIMVEFVHDLSKRFNPREIVFRCKNKKIKKNIFDILSNIRSNHAFNSTEGLTTVLQDVISLDNDQISPSTCSNVSILEPPKDMEARNHSPDFLVDWELINNDSYPGIETPENNIVVYSSPNLFIIDDELINNTSEYGHEVKADFNSSLTHNSLFNRGKKRSYEESTEQQYLKFSHFSLIY